jgi:glycerate kinase
MRVLVAPDKFKGTATASTIAETVATAVRAAGHDAAALPLADGGEGLLDALGGANRTTTVTGPLGDPVDAAWRLANKQAVIEMAQASGLTLVGGAAGNDALAASTYGTGELIQAALDRGARHVIVGVGGSATTDGGWGAIQALHPLARLKGVRLEVACDVTTGFVDAARVFGPQKGATPAQVALLTRRLERLVDVYRDEFGVDVARLEGAGAAGGLAGGLGAIGGQLVAGFEVVADHIGLAEAVAAADVVITGEGRVDVTSFTGKVVGGVAEIATAAGVPVLVVAGAIADGVALPPGVEAVALVAEVGEAAAVADPATAAARVVLARLGTYRSRR